MTNVPAPPHYPPGRGLLAGKTVLVTAAAGTGIGFATAKRCVEEGAQVAISDIHERRLGESAAKLGAHAVVLDVTDEEDVRRGLADVLGALGHLDVLVNNAGLGGTAKLVDMTDQQWSSVLDVTLNGTMRMTRAALQHMCSRGTGAIVNNASVVGWRAQAGQAHYAAAKAGVMALTRCAAIEAAEHGVRVNAVAPSLAMHPHLAKVTTEQLLAELTTLEAFGRAAEPWEVANVIVFLASDLASYMTGEVISVSSQHTRDGQTQSERPREAAAGEVAAVDGEGVAGDERRVVGREEQRGSRDLLRLPDASEQVLGLEPFEDRTQTALLERRGHRRRDHARAQAVDAHVVRSVVDRHAAREEHDTALRRVVRGLRLPTFDALDAREVHDAARATRHHPRQHRAATSQVPLRLMSSTRLHSASSIVSAVPKLDTPAALTSTSIGPSSATMCATAASTLAASRTSPAANAAHACSPGTATSIPPTRAPSSPKRREHAAPMPDAAPVTSATLPSSLPVMSTFPSRRSCSSVVPRLRARALARR